MKHYNNDCNENDYVQHNESMTLYAVTYVDIAKEYTTVTLGIVAHWH